MFYRIALQPEPSHSSDLSPVKVEKFAPEVLQHIGRQVEALLSRHNNLEMYRRSIERQLGSIAAHIHEEDVLLVPRSVFLLLELRGSGGVSADLEQIARILCEAGYWKPPARVQDYRRYDVYHLGKSAQKLFDDYAQLDRRVKRLLALLGYINERIHMEPEATPQEVFDSLVSIPGGANAQGEVDAIVEMLGQSTHSRWFGWLFVHRGNIATL